MDPLIGKILSERYEVVERIGTGGMANVYKARCNVLHRFVAVKVLKEEYRKEEDFIKRFRTESRAVALLSHPNIVAVYDVGVDLELPYMVMELIEGITLKEYIGQKKRLDPREAVFFAMQIVKALEHAHSRKIVHRDIKPQNIMILRDGTIKVADFGIARFTLSNTQTITETAIGSVHYLSPEQAKGSISDEKSDIYSLGVVLYEMVTGQVPFDAENPVMVAIMHLQQVPRRPHELAPGLPDGLESIILRAMCRDPLMRYQSAGDMHADLDAFRKNPNIRFQYTFTRDEQQETHIFKPVSDRQLEGAKAEQQRGRVMMYIKLGLIAVALIVLIFLGSQAVKLFQNLMEFGSFSPQDTEEIEVPPLVNLNYDAVLRNEVNYEDFVIVLEESVYDDTVEAGTILEQEPAAGEVVRPGSEIRVTATGRDGPDCPNQRGV